MATRQLPPVAENNDARCALQRRHIRCEVGCESRHLGRPNSIAALLIECMLRQISNSRRVLMETNTPITTSLLMC